jgi:DNA-binding response OmpR family regulator
MEWSAHVDFEGAAAMGKGRVLIVEDEADLAWVEQFNLETEGYEVKVAPEGLTAVEQLKTFSPDVVVLDVMLPHLDGWAILERTRELPPEQRPEVIMVSAVAGVADRARGETLGVNRFLAKPFDMDDFLSAVGEAIASA